MKIELVIAEIFQKSESPTTHMFLLREREGQRRIMLVFGDVEAQGIATSIVAEDIQIERPLTHDLFELITGAFGIRLNYIVINRFSEDKFHSLLCYERDGEVHYIDARVTDAMAIALRANAPMYIEEDILEKHQVQGNNGTAFSLPVELADAETLHDALALAIKEENYELALQLKKELRAREDDTDVEDIENLKN